MIFCVFWQKKENELDRLKYDLTDREKAIVHAKNMWMRENERAAQLSENLDGNFNKLNESTFMLN